MSSGITKCQRSLSDSNPQHPLTVEVSPLGGSNSEKPCGPPLKRSPKFASQANMPLLEAITLGMARQAIEPGETKQGHRPLRIITPTHPGQIASPAVRVAEGFFAEKKE